VNLAVVFRSALDEMDGVTKTVQETIVVTPWIGEDLYGARTFGAPRSLKGVVDRSRRESRLSDGRIVTTTAVVTFLEPFAAVGAVDRDEPLDSRDKILLQSGPAGEILSIRGSIHPGTGERFFLEVHLG
jgi:hypothetical protein